MGLLICQSLQPPFDSDCKDSVMRFHVNGLTKEVSSLTSKAIIIRSRAPTSSLPFLMILGGWTSQRVFNCMNSIANFLKTPPNRVTKGSKRGVDVLEIPSPAHRSFHPLTLEFLQVNKIEQESESNNLYQVALSSERVYPQPEVRHHLPARRQGSLILLKELKLSISRLSQHSLQLGHMLQALASSSLLLFLPFALISFMAFLHNRR